MGDTRIRLLVVDPDALVRAMDDLLAEVERLSAFEAGMKLAWKERFEWKTTFTSEDEAE